MGADAQVTLDLPQHVLQYLDAQPALTLATASRGGVPRATTLTYVNDGVTVYIWTRPDTTTARQMEENPVVSIAIGPYADDWRETKGIQAAAEAQVVLNPTELTRVVAPLKGRCVVNHELRRGLRNGDGVLQSGHHAEILALRGVQHPSP